MSVDQVVANFGTQALSSKTTDKCCVRRSGCCQLRHPAANSQIVAAQACVRRSGCCQLRHPCSDEQDHRPSRVSVDQVVANFGTIGIRSPNFQKLRVRRSGCCQLRHRLLTSSIKSSQCVRRSGCCQLRHQTYERFSTFVEGVSVDQVVANFGTAVPTPIMPSPSTPVSVDQVVANFGT